ncbi:hypothetical protein SAMN04515648_2958 [Phyllobacterium sp. CL33Tsu]|uniref:hypothetical protein n=1 Tax=Phyllobacterium sp. CL33Tsu TaxID=1798191 RepID=UPI0008EE30BF|nr:hypothetical protein [Phyllobacterium sp. CL33Tsu]SFJ16539.1 hypothetical protein SAMN04515648_2958 [Phyllobacterium sp. CL33Tsu]
MFKKKTVFVVGAGASKEVNLPVGVELKSIIADKVDIFFDRGQLSRGDEEIVFALRDMLQSGGSPVDINPYAAAGRHIASAMPQALSIDNFLHTHSTNEKIVLMGKIGIAASILQAERESSIYFEHGQGDKLNFREIGDSWHNTFCKMAHANVLKEDLDTIFDNVAIITFNYDRCIEHYVSHSLSNYFGITLQDAQELTKQFVVIHPYGQVGKLPWQVDDGSGCAYGEEPTWDILLPIAQQLRTFTEWNQQDPVIGQMNNLLLNAEQVIYLGFSYAPINMKLLYTKGIGFQKDVIGTAYRMPDPAVKAAKSAIMQSMVSTGTSALVRTVELADLLCNQLLTNYMQQISD